MAAFDRGHSGQGHSLRQELAVVRKMLDRLETKVLENDAEHVPREGDQEFRLALQRIGDDRLTQLALGYAVCAKGLTAPMVSRAWTQELAEEAEEVHDLLLRRLQRLERLARSPVGRLWLRLQARLHRILRKSLHQQQWLSPKKDGNRK